MVLSRGSNREWRRRLTFWAKNISDTLDAFVKGINVLLALAGRYDGLDLPDDQCRLLILADSPAAVNSLERHLMERWKMGPVLRTRERTRLIQGMGRCTRSATDFAVIVWLGQSLVDLATSKALSYLPPELATEIKWGVEQSQLAKKPASLTGMMLGLISDPEYRKGADEAIGDMTSGKQDEQPAAFETSGADEVRFAKAFWDDNFAHAHQIAHQIADHLTAPELAGYRAWWWYLGSRAASLMNDKASEQDCLKRGASCGVNAGWLNFLLHKRNKAAIIESSPNLESNAEGLWDHLTKWGWAGPAFEREMAEMLKNLEDIYHVRFHQGLETLGKCFGAVPTRTTEQGAPDVIWSFPDDFQRVRPALKVIVRPISRKLKLERISAGPVPEITTVAVVSAVRNKCVNVDASLTETHNLILGWEHRHQEAISDPGKDNSQDASRRRKR
jgi:hypothetical protein